MKKVIIIGAGPAGLTAGYDLISKSSDYEVTIIEETPVVGGLCARFENEGNVLDPGGHMFISNNSEVKKFWNSILPAQGKPSSDDLILDRYCKIANGGPDPEDTEDVLLSREKVTRIYKENKFYDSPVIFNNKEAVKNFGIATSIKSGFSQIGGNVFKHKEESLEDYYVNRSGKQLFTMFQEEYLEKIWGTKPSRMSSAWGPISEKSLIAPVISTDKTKKDYEKLPAPFAGRYYYPKFGAYQMWENVADRFIEMGGSIHKNCKVEGITTNGKKITSVKCYADGDEFIVACDYLISSMPIRDLVMGMDEVDDKIRIAAEDLSYRGLVSVCVELKDMVWKNDTEEHKSIDNIAPDSFVYISNPNVKVSRIQIYNNFSPYMIRNKDHIYLGMNYYCNEGDYYWSMNDRDWKKAILGDLNKLGIIKSEDSLISYTKIKYNKAFPSYDNGYEKRDKVVKFLKTFDNLYCIGRNGQHRFSSIDESMKTSFEAVKNILGLSQNKEMVWNINEVSNDDNAEKSYNSALLSGEGEYRGNAVPIQKQIKPNDGENSEYVPPRRMRRPMMTPIKKADPDAKLTEPVILNNSVVIAARPQKSIPFGTDAQQEVAEENVRSSFTPEENAHIGKALYVPPKPKTEYIKEEVTETVEEPVTEIINEEIIDVTDDAKTEILEENFSAVSEENAFEMTTDTMTERVEEAADSVAEDIVSETVETEETAVETVDEVIAQSEENIFEEAVLEADEEISAESEEESVEEAVAEIAEEIAEPAEEIIEESIAEPVEEISEDSVEENVEETITETVEEISADSDEDSVEEAVAEPAEEINEEAISEPVEEISEEEISEEAVETDVEEAPAESVEDTIADVEDISVETEEKTETADENIVSDEVIETSAEEKTEEETLTDTNEETSDDPDSSGEDSDDADSEEENKIPEEYMDPLDRELNELYKEFEEKSGKKKTTKKKKKSSTKAAKDNKKSKVDKESSVEVKAEEPEIVETASTEIPVAEEIAVQENPVETDDVKESEEAVSKAETPAVETPAVEIPVEELDPLDAALNALYSEFEQEHKSDKKKEEVSDETIESAEVTENSDIEETAETEKADAEETNTELIEESLETEEAESVDFEEKAETENAESAETFEETSEEKEVTVEDTFEDSVDSSEENESVAFEETSENEEETLAVTSEDDAEIAEEKENVDPEETSEIEETESVEIKDADSSEEKAEEEKAEEETEEVSSKDDSESKDESSEAEEKSEEASSEKKSEKDSETKGSDKVVFNVKGSGETEEEEKGEVESISLPGFGNRVFSRRTMNNSARYKNERRHNSSSRSIYNFETVESFKNETDPEILQKLHDEKIISREKVLENSIEGDPVSFIRVETFERDDVIDITNPHERVVTKEDIANVKRDPNFKFVEEKVIRRPSEVARELEEAAGKSKEIELNVAEKADVVEIVVEDDKAVEVKESAEVSENKAKDTVDVSNEKETENKATEQETVVEKDETIEVSENKDTQEETAEVSESKEASDKIDVEETEKEVTEGSAEEQKETAEASEPEDSSEESDKSETEKEVTEEESVAEQEETAEVSEPEDASDDNADESNDDVTEETSEDDNEVSEEVKNEEIEEESEISFENANDQFDVESVNNAEFAVNDNAEFIDEEEEEEFEEVTYQDDDVPLEFEDVSTDRYNAFAPSPVSASETFNVNEESSKSDFESFDESEDVIEESEDDKEVKNVEEDDTLSKLDEQAAGRAIVKSWSNKYQPSVPTSEDAKKDENIIRSGTNSNDIYGSDFALSYTNKREAMNQMVEKYDGGDNLGNNNIPSSNIVKSETKIEEEKPANSSGDDFHIVKESANRYDFSASEIARKKNLENNEYDVDYVFDERPIPKKTYRVFGDAPEGSTNDPIKEKPAENNTENSYSAGKEKPSLFGGFKKKEIITEKSDGSKANLLNSKIDTSIVFKNARVIKSTKISRNIEEEPSKTREEKPEKVYSDKQRVIAIIKNGEYIPVGDEKKNPVQKSDNSGDFGFVNLHTRSEIENEEKQSINTFSGLSSDASVISGNAVNSTEYSSVSSGITSELNADDLNMNTEFAAENTDIVSEQVTEAIAETNEVKETPKKENPFFKSKKNKKKSKKSKWNNEVTETEEDIVQPPISVMLDAKEAAEMTEPLESPISRQRNFKI
ncbi:MAG: FAD-dependent oxidoreductase [Lachnospiraceae bacterium]|nr:FAD-dependent oxidoreductase [Lachnospiraceae bacterium]